MGKRVKGWTPPDDDDIVTDVVEQKPTSWTPPDEDAVVETVKKKELSSPSSSALPGPGKPSKKSSPKSTPSSKYKYDPTVGKWTNLFRELVHAYNTPISEEEKAKETPDPFINAIKRGGKLAETASIVGPTEDKPTLPKIERVAQLQKETNELPASDAYKKFSGAETFTDAFKSFAEDPARIVVELSAESISSMVQYGASRMAAGAVTGAAIGSVVPGVGTVAGAGGGTIVGMADTSLGLEFTGSFMESLKEAGVDTSNPEALKRAFEDDAIISEARSHAFKKGIPIALFDLVSGGVAGKIVSKPAKSLVGKFGAGAIEMAVQSAFGAGGELAGQVVAGEKIQPGAILGEAFGEIATAPVEVATGALTFNKSPKEVVAEQTQNVNAGDVSALDKKAEIIQDKVESMERHVTAGQTDAKQIILNETPEVTPTENTVDPVVPEDQAEEEVQAQSDQEVTEESVAPEVTQDVADSNIPQTKYLTEEQTGTYNFATTKQTQDAVPQSETESLLVQPASGDSGAVVQGDTQGQEVARESIQESPRQEERAESESPVKQELTFTRTVRDADEVGGIKGVPPKNQFKLNQGFNFERVQVVLDDQQAELYQQGVRAKRNIATSADPANKRAINFANEVNRIARENRDKNKEVLLDFRTQDGNNIRGGTTPVPQVRDDNSGQQPLASVPIESTTVSDQAIQEEAVSSGSAVPPSVPPEQAGSTEELPRTPEERTTYTRIKDDPNISHAIKQGIADEAKKYIPRNLKKVTSKEADAIIDAKGLDEAVKMYLDDSSGIYPDVDTAIGIKLFDRLQAADNTQDAVRVFEKLSIRGTELGQAVNAYKLMQEKTMINLVNKSIQNRRKKFREQNEWRSQDAKTEIDKINTDAVEKVLNSPKVKNRISSEIKKGNVKKAIDFLETLKVSTKGKALDAVYGISAAAWNTVITAVQKGLQVGLTISQAINKAVSGVKEPSFERSKAVTFLDDKLRDYRVTLDPTKAIKAELQEQGRRIDDIIRTHYSEQASTKKNLIDKLIKDANIATDQAQAIADELSAEFDRFTKDAKEKALNRLLPKPSKKISKKERKDTVDKLIEQSNIGALSEDQYSDIITDQLGVPKLTAEQLKEVSDLTNKVQKAKGDTAKLKAAQDLLNYVENLKGWSWFDATQAVWYANILSGPTTILINNPFANLANLMAELAVDVARNPKDAPFIIGRVVTGLTRGLLQAKDVLVTGYSPYKGPDYKTESKPLLERLEFKGGKINPLNWLKFVTRAIKAGDILFFHPLKEQRLAVLAILEAKKNGRNTPNKQDMHNLREQLIKEDYDTAFEQASSEGFSGRDQKIRAWEILEEMRPEYATQEAQSFAARATFNVKPEGTLGNLAEWLNVGKRSMPWLNFIIPFVNTPINVANEYLNYFPIVGAKRALTGKIGWNPESKTYRKLTKEEQARIALKTVIGTLAMAALYGMDDPDDKDGKFEITANGTGDTQKNFELERSGWRPYSIRVGDTWISYKYTPMAIPMAAIGFAKDTQRYKKESNITEELWTMGIGSFRFLMDMSALTGLSDLFDIFSKEDISQYGSMAEKLMKSMEKIGKSILIPNYFTQMSRLVQEFTESPIKRADQIGDAFIRDMPVLRDHLGNLYDAFGDPVVPKQLEKLIPLNGHRAPEDVAMFDFLKDHKLFVGKPSPQNFKPNGTPMTEDEYAKWSVASAQAIKKRLMREYKMYSRQKNREVVKDWFDQVKQEERKQAKLNIFGLF